MLIWSTLTKAAARRKVGSMTNDPRTKVADELRRQSQITACPLTAGLCARAATDVLARGPVWDALRPHAHLPAGAILPLRFAGAAHRLALAGDAPDYAAHLPTCGGDGDVDAAWRALRVLAGEGALAEGLHHPVQTNEPGRLRALLPAFAAVHESTGLPLRMLELGASAGLLLRRPPDLPVVNRRGCDANPLDPGDPTDRLLLQSFVWASQVERFRNLTAALGEAAADPVVVERADAGEWLAAQLDGRREGRATVVFHSVVWQYLSPETRREIDAALARAARRATADAPLAYVRFEPVGDHGETWLQQWPGGHDRQVARSGYHGQDVELAALPPTVLTANRQWIH
jgi:hypothetical protein